MGQLRLSHTLVYPFTLLGSSVRDRTLKVRTSLIKIIIKLRLGESKSLGSDNIYNESSYLRR